MQINGGNQIRDQESTADKKQGHVADNSRKDTTADKRQQQIEVIMEEPQQQIRDNSR